MTNNASSSVRTFRGIADGQHGRTTGAVNDRHERPRNSCCCSEPAEGHYPYRVARGEIILPAQASIAGCPASNHAAHRPLLNTGVTQLAGAIRFLQTEDRLWANLFA